MVDEDIAQAEALAASGWQQGSLLPSTIEFVYPLTWADPAQQAAAVIRKAWRGVTQHQPQDVPVAVPRRLRQSERLVVVTHTCDIMKTADAFPQVELALAFATANAVTLAEANNLGSARYFRLGASDIADPLVLDFRWRTFVDKGFLLQHVPDNSLITGMTPSRRYALGRWLGRRFSRPVLSDADVRTLSDPIRQRWRQLSEEEPERAVAYSEEFPEFRYRRGNDGGLTLYLLSAKEAPDATIAMEVGGVLVEALQPLHGSVGVSTERLSYHTFTVADLLTTEQIDLEWASYDERGEELTPLPAM